jgi:hypothetical protein
MYLGSIVHVLCAGPGQNKPDSKDAPSEHVLPTAILLMVIRQSCFIISVPSSYLYYSNEF